MQFLVLNLGSSYSRQTGAFLPRDPPRISMLTIFHNFAKKRRNKQKQRPTTHHIRSDADNILDQHDGTRSSNETQDWQFEMEIKESSTCDSEKAASNGEDVGSRTGMGGERRGRFPLFFLLFFPFRRRKSPAGAVSSRRDEGSISVIVIINTTNLILRRI